jgi:hypothetical protein
LVVVHHGSHVERRVVVEEAHLGLPRGELALVGGLLIELVRRLGSLPDVLVETSVDDDRLLDANGLDALGGPDRGIVLTL